jgi:acyl-CoA synthetase (NDP forming)
VHKVGRSEAGARSAISHTGALAGRDEVYDALFTQVGAYRTRGFAELIDVPAALATGRRMRGNRLGILTSTGGAGVLIADACGVLGLETPPPDAATAARLAGVLIGESAVPDRNPVDVTLAGLKSEIFSAASSAMLESPVFDALVTVVGASGLASPDLAAGPIVAAQDTTDKPVVAYVSPSAPDIVQRLNQQGVPTFDTPEGCAAALGALRQFAAPASRSIPNRAPPSTDLLDLPSGTLNEVESRHLLARFGIRGVRESTAITPEEAARLAAELGSRVVLKVLARDVPHKSEVGGVAVGVLAADVASRAADMLAQVHQRVPEARVEGLLVQEQIDGIEMIVGVRRDPLVGPIVLVGAGGVAVEVMHDTVLRLAPVGLDEALAMIDSLRSAPLLRGYRGRSPADSIALAECIVALTEMAAQLGERLLEAEINPLFVLPAGQGAVAADALVVLGQPEDQRRG